MESNSFILCNTVHVLLMYTSGPLNKQEKQNDEICINGKQLHAPAYSEQYTNMMMSPVLNIRMNTGVLNLS